MLLEGKKAIITGGTRGIGYAIACRFIEEGATVTVFGSRQETADAAVEKLTAVYPDAKVWGRSCDLTSLEAVTEAFTQLQPIWRSRYGRQQCRNLPALTPFGLHGRGVRQSHGPQRRRCL